MDSTFIRPMKSQKRIGDMELKEFIKTAISDITGAISELQEETTNGSIINPTLPNSIANTTLVVHDEIRPIERLQFDVAVTVSESSQIDGNAKAGISVFGAKIGTVTSANEQSASRLTFSIPILFPSVHVDTPQELMRKNRPKRPHYD